MNNGWYRVIGTDGYVRSVVEVYRNNTKEGSVVSLQKKGCTLEPVQVLNERELNTLILDELTKRMAVDYD